MSDLPQRGRDTRWGESGWCAACDRWVPEGPDACIGLRPGVKAACCGHGRINSAYVNLKDGTLLFGADARRWLGLATWP